MRSATGSPNLRLTSTTEVTRGVRSATEVTRLTSSGGSGVGRSPAGTSRTGQHRHRARLRQESDGSAAWAHHRRERLESSGREARGRSPGQPPATSRDTGQSTRSQGTVPTAVVRGRLTSRSRLRLSARTATSRAGWEIRATRCTTEISAVRARAGFDDDAPRHRGPVATGRIGRARVSGPRRVLPLVRTLFFGRTGPGAQRSGPNHDLSRRLSLRFDLYSSSSGSSHSHDRSSRHRAITILTC